jgi:sigma-B regulation protein RsbU (phosphoserine phosphatase)
LVVDDDEANRESLRRRLERRGYKLTVAIDGKHALQLIEHGKFDLVILDVMMPGISGLEVLDHVRKQYSPTQLPIIMATAKDQSEDVVAALERGANDYVTKPLDFAVVSARVRTQLDLKEAADQVVELGTQLLARNEELLSANLRLVENAKRTAQELEAGAKVQRAFLPHVDPSVPGARFSWIFEPCSQLAGDSLNVVRLDAENVAFYVLDVSGHGVAASLLAVVATRLLSASGNGESLVLQTSPTGEITPTAPSDVAAKLTERFSLEATGQFITLFYAVYNLKTRELTYVSAGHPGAVHLASGQEPIILDGTGTPIGVGDKYDQQTRSLAVGDRLYLYSDGVTEAMNAEHALFGTDRLLQALKTGLKLSMKQSISSLNDELRDWQGGSAPRDDISILGMECE